MDRIECMKLQLMSAIENAMQDLSTTDTKELGEAVDMIKDIEEAIYYCTITKAMEKQEKDKEKYYFAVKIIFTEISKEKLTLKTLGIE